MFCVASFSKVKQKRRKCEISQREEAEVLRRADDVRMGIFENDFLHPFANMSYPHLSFRPFPVIQIGKGHSWRTWSLTASRENRVWESTYRNRRTTVHRVWRAYVNGTWQIDWSARSDWVPIIVGSFPWQSSQFSCPTEEKEKIKTIKLNNILPKHCDYRIKSLNRKSHLSDFRIFSLHFQGIKMIKMEIYARQGFTEGILTICVVSRSGFFLSAQKLYVKADSSAGRSTLGFPFVAVARGDKVYIEPTIDSLRIESKQKTTPE